MNAGYQPMRSGFVILYWLVIYRLMRKVLKPIPGATLSVRSITLSPEKVLPESVTCNEPADSTVIFGNQADFRLALVVAT